MGYLTAMGECANCHRLFSFNPELVPSVRVNGHREPVCRPCIEQANTIRKGRGLGALQVLPGAYEAQDEGAL